MGTVVFQSLAELLLDERNYSLEEMVSIGMQRYGMEEDELKFNLRMIVDIHTKYTKNLLLINGRYHKNRTICNDMHLMLQGQENMPEGYFEGREKFRQLFLDLEKRYGYLKQPGPKKPGYEDIPF